MKYNRQKAPVGGRHAGDFFSLNAFGRPHGGLLQRIGRPHGGLLQ